MTHTPVRDQLEPPPWSTLPGMLRERARAVPQATVVLDGETSLTVGQLRVQAAAVARALTALGVAAGDRVAVWAPNTWQWVVAAFGCWDIGAIVVPLSTRNKGIESEQILTRTGCRVLFTTPDFLGADYIAMLDEVAGHATDARPFADLPELDHVVLFDGTHDRAGVLTWEAFLRLAPTVPGPDVEKRALAVRPDDPIEILSTSGTTGEPKGVLLAGAQILRAYWDWSHFVGLRTGDRYPIVSPFAHGFGINAGIIASIMRLAAMVPIAVFDPEQALEQVERLGLTVLAGPPNLFARILARPDLPDRDVSSLRVAIVGAAAVPTELVRAMRDRLGLEQVVNAYGLIEGSVVTMTRPDDPPEVVAATAGRPLPDVGVQLVDAHGRPVPDGERGEILVRGYGVMSGYWNAEDKTRSAVDADGWLHTGDIGVLDPAGNLTIVDRKKDMFIVGGFNAYPAEIENLLIRHPDVETAAVVAVPDPALGEVAWAYVVPREGARPEPADITAWARRNMSNYKVPRKVTLVTSLPVTANGKIDKVLLRGWTQTAPALDPSEFRRVLGHFATGVVAITAIDPATGTPTGLAANSFTSVSLDPPLVAFCVAHTSSSWPRIREAERYCVNILAAHQEKVCRQLARKGPEKFDGVPWHASPAGTPVLDNAVAWLEVATHRQHTAGDHDIVVAEVHRIAARGGAPLVFFQGAYGQFAR
ncbi:MAG: AMP-binding protein [Streptomycetaceae bacterium]|nr:AMP-binding protein [Streptomycetaceae bacterium]